MTVRRSESREHLPIRTRPTCPLLLASAVVAACAALGACADPVKTAARGERELTRFGDDALVRVAPAGLTPVSSSAVAAHADDVILGLRVAIPTAFTRTFAMGTMHSTEVFAAFDVELHKSRARLATSRCEISVPRESRVYAATSHGDDLRITISVVPAHAAAPVEYQVEVARAASSPATGLLGCLDRQLPSGAYTSVWAGRPRSTAELCSLLRDDVRRVLFGASLGRQKDPEVCIIKGRRAGRKVWVQLLDRRELSLARLLDDVAPDVDPTATRIDESTTGSLATLLPALPTGAVAVSSNDRAALDVVVRSLLSG